MIGRTRLPTLYSTWHKVLLLLLRYFTISCLIDLRITSLAFQEIKAFIYGHIYVSVMGMLTHVYNIMLRYIRVCTEYVFAFSLVATLTSKSCYFRAACEWRLTTFATLWEHTFTLLKNRSLVWNEPECLGKILVFFIIKQIKKPEESVKLWIFYLSCARLI